MKTWRKPKPLNSTEHCFCQRIATELICKCLAMSSRVKPRPLKRTSLTILVPWFAIWSLKTGTFLYSAEGSP